MEIHLTAVAETTQSESLYEKTKAADPVPGVVLLWSSTPQFRPIPLIKGVPLPMGRENLDGLPLGDDQVSRHHAQLVHDGKQFQLTDTGSRNGTFLNGEKIEGSVSCGPGSLIRIGRTLLICCADVRSFASAAVTKDDGYVVGPTLRAALDRIARFATAGMNVLITGQNGTGKERAAGLFHKAAAPRGPMVTINCSNLSPTTAHVDLFGALKGSYTDAKADRSGFIADANGGVAFLDELGDLPLPVQPMLLRAIQNGEISVLGETSPRKVNVRYVSATNKDLKAMIAQGTFREDLFHRLAQETVRIPTLRERPEEIPFLVHQVMTEKKRATDPKVVEAMLLRQWTGNVRELLNVAEGAATNAEAEDAAIVRKEHLGAPEPAPNPLNRTSPAITAFKEPAKPTREELQRALDDAKGNKSAAAKALGMHKTQLYRELEKHGLAGSPEPQD